MGVTNPIFPMFPTKIDHFSSKGRIHELLRKKNQMPISTRLPEDIDTRLDFLTSQTGQTKAFYIREAFGVQAAAQEPHIDIPLFFSPRRNLFLRDRQSPEFDKFTISW
jgi:hypothetical protein